MKDERRSGMKNKKIDMLNGPLVGKIVIFALPLALSSILQQLFNSADLAVVADLTATKPWRRLEAILHW